jgi:hypothetical protein
MERLAHLYILQKVVSLQIPRLWAGKPAGSRAVFVALAARILGAGALPASVSGANKNG